MEPLQQPVTPTVLRTETPSVFAQQQEKAKAHAEEQSAAQAAYDEMVKQRQKKIKKEMRDEELSTFFMYGAMTGLFLAAGAYFAYKMLSSSSHKPEVAALPPRAPPPQMPQLPRVRSVASPAMSGYY
jgi:hypothetical protein